jgi:hypothetical protein
VEKKREAEQRRLRGALAGAAAPKKDQPQLDTMATQVPMKEVTKGVRWVAITGVLNYKALRDHYIAALKRPEVAYPHFKQLDIERQVKQPDGSWSDWEPIDVDRNREILDNLPEEEEEWTPETVRISALVHPLPFLKAGIWERVHVARMVPAEKLQASTPVEAIDAEAQFGGSRRVEGPTGPPPGEMMGSSAAMGMPGDMEGMYGGTGETINFEKTEAEEVMVRALDFTVEPDETYRFRLRVVVFNPNLGREDVSPGVDTKSVELYGPWSDPTEELTIPSDVAVYALNKEPYVRQKLDQVNFEVARWRPEDGVTVVKRFTAAPGELIGEVRSADIPSSEGKGKQSQKVDFNSHRIVLDVLGGNQPIPAVLGPGLGGLVNNPALSLVVRPDGAVVVRSQANDVHDLVRKDMAENYARELKESDKKRQSAQANRGEGL